MSNADCAARDHLPHPPGADATVPPVKALDLSMANSCPKCNFCSAAYCPAVGGVHRKDEQVCHCPVTIVLDQILLQIEEACHCGSCANPHASRCRIGTAAHIEHVEPVLKRMLLRIRRTVGSRCSSRSKPRSSRSKVYLRIGASSGTIFWSKHEMERIRSANLANSGQGGSPSGEHAVESAIGPIWQQLRVAFIAASVGSSEQLRRCRRVDQENR